MKQENIELCCQKGNLEADLELGKQRGNALAEQISYLGEFIFIGSPSMLRNKQGSCHALNSLQTP